MIKGRGAFNITELVQVRQRQARATARGGPRARPRATAFPRTPSVARGTSVLPLPRPFALPPLL